MKKIFCSGEVNLKSEDIYKLKYFDIEVTNNIEKADVLLANIDIYKNNMFEPNPIIIKDIAFIQSKNLPIVTYGFNRSVAEVSGNVFGLEEDEFGLSILRDVITTINGKEGNYGDFLYENRYGNGMIVYNNAIINIYDDNLGDIIEVVYCLINEGSIKESKLRSFDNIEGINEYINGTYKEVPIFEKRKLTNERENIFQETEIKDLENTCYLIGPDVFYVSESKVSKGELIKVDLLNDRIAANNKNQVKSITPMELGEKTEYDLAKVINGNNTLAKRCPMFTANLPKMPLETSAVDSGSLYEIVLNVNSGGFGVVNIEDDIAEDVKKYLINHKSISVLIEATNEQMSDKLTSMIGERLLVKIIKPIQ